MSQTRANVVTLQRLLPSWLQHYSCHFIPSAKVPWISRRMPQSCYQGSAQKVNSTATAQFASDAVQWFHESEAWLCQQNSIASFLKKKLIGKIESKLCRLFEWGKMSEKWFPYKDDLVECHLRDLVMRQGLFGWKKRKKSSSSSFGSSHLISFLSCFAPRVRLFFWAISLLDFEERKSVLFMFAMQTLLRRQVSNFMHISFESQQHPPRSTVTLISMTWQEEMLSTANQTRPPRTPFSTMLRLTIPPPEPERKEKCSWLISSKGCIMVLDRTIREIWKAYRWGFLVVHGISELFHVHVHRGHGVRVRVVQLLSLLHRHVSFFSQKFPLSKFLWIVRPC